MAESTLANSLKSIQFSAAIVRANARSKHRQLQSEFRVFPIAEGEYHWRIAALETNGTISRHKSLSFALRKCTRLNKQRRGGTSHEIN